MRRLILLCFLLLPPSAATAQFIGPDLLLAEIAYFDDVRRWGTVGGITAYSFATEACNIGDREAFWLSNSAAHPVIGQNLFRLKDGRFEQIGQAWVKHGFATINGTHCGPCSATDGETLGVGCSDPYSAALNGNQSRLGPKSQINASRGSNIFPFSAPSAPATVGRRLQVHNSDVDPAQNEGALYFAEAQYVAADDAFYGHARNNVGWREFYVYVTFDILLNIAPIGATHRGDPAIYAWPQHEPDVRLHELIIDDDGDDGYRGWMFVAARATYQGGCTWHYEYAVQNYNSFQSANSFFVPLPDGVVPTNVGFHDVDYHSGEPYSGTDWTSSVDAAGITWSTQSFSQNPNTNALRWGTLYNFRFDADAPPRCDASLQLGIFRTPEKGPLVVQTAAPGTGDACSQTGDLDFDCDVDAEDYGWFLSAYGRCAGEPGYAADADMNLDQCIDLADYQLWIARYRAWIGQPSAPPPSAVYPLALGDVNRDGHIDLADVPAMVDVLLGVDTDADHWSAADLDQSGVVNGADLAGFVKKVTSSE